MKVLNFSYKLIKILDPVDELQLDHLKSFSGILKVLR